MTELLIAAQAWAFYFASAETTSNTTAFAIIELAHNVTVQDRLRQEVTEAIKLHGELTFDTLKSMPYMEQVLSETMRLHPVIQVIKRQVTKPYTMPDGRVTLPIGTRIIIPVRNLHRDPKYYPEPEKFEPERFSHEATQQRHQFAYIPFGNGHRMCIGKTFAIVQMKLILAALVSQFEFRLTPEAAYPPIYSSENVLTLPKHGVPVEVSRISKQVQSNKNYDL